MWQILWTKDTICDRFYELKILYVADFMNKRYYMWQILSTKDTTCDRYYELKILYVADFMN